MLTGLVDRKRDPLSLSSEPGRFGDTDIPLPYSWQTSRELTAGDDFARPAHLSSGFFGPRAPFVSSMMAWEQSRASPTLLPATALRARAGCPREMRSETRFFTRRVVAMRVDYALVADVQEYAVDACSAAAANPASAVRGGTRPNGAARVHDALRRRHHRGRTSETL